MAKTIKKLPKATSYFEIEDQFSGGVAWCPGCALELNARFATRILGEKTVIVGTPSCSAPVMNGQNMGAWHTFGFYGCVMTGVASSASGIARSYKMQGIDDATIVCWTGDGGAQDIGFQALSGAAERNEKIIYICYDNEGYMNTGIQRSSATQMSQWTSTTPIGPEHRGKDTFGKDMPMIMAMHNVPYVATASVSHLADYAKKLQKAKEAAKTGFAYLHVFTPCLVGARIASDASITYARDAVKNNYFPLWEAEYKEFRITQKVSKPKPIRDMIKSVGKYKHMSDQEIDDLQAHVDKKMKILQGLCALSEEAEA